MYLLYETLSPDGRVIDTTLPLRVVGGLSLLPLLSYVYRYRVQLYRVLFMLIVTIVQGLTLVGALLLSIMA